MNQLRQQRYLCSCGKTTTADHWARHQTSKKRQAIRARLAQGQLDGGAAEEGSDGDEEGEDEGGDQQAVPVPVPVPVRPPEEEILPKDAFFVLGDGNKVFVPTSDSDQM